ncbi:SEC22 [Scenedesmus sp. PABB004]|nr:SEC22 [Scenedesmus sp. PABB004]
MVRLTLIARLSDGLPLAEGLDRDESPEMRQYDYKSQAKAIFKRLSQTPHAGQEPRVSVESGPCTFHYLLDGNAAFLTLTEKGYPKKLAFQYLEELAGEFSRLYGAQVDGVTRPYAFIKFDTFIQKTKKLFQDTRSQRNVAALTADLTEVHQIMSRNIAEVLGQGEKLDSMTKLSSTLAMESKSYSKRAKDLHTQALLRKYLPVAVVVGVVLLVLLFRKLLARPHSGAAWPERRAGSVRTLEMELAGQQAAQLSAPQQRLLALACEAAELGRGGGRAEALEVLDGMPHGQVWELLCALAAQQAGSRAKSPPSSLRGSRGRLGGLPGDADDTLPLDRGVPEGSARRRRGSGAETDSSGEACFTLSAVAPPVGSTTPRLLREAQDSEPDAQAQPVNARLLALQRESSAGGGRFDLGASLDLLGQSTADASWLSPGRAADLAASLAASLAAPRGALHDGARGAWAAPLASPPLSGAGGGGPVGCSPLRASAALSARAGPVSVPVVFAAGAGADSDADEAGSDAASTPGSPCSWRGAPPSPPGRRAGGGACRTPPSSERRGSHLAPGPALSGSPLGDAHRHQQLQQQQQQQEQQEQASPCTPVAPAGRRGGGLGRALLGPVNALRRSFTAKKPQHGGPAAGAPSSGAASPALTVVSRLPSFTATAAASGGSAGRAPGGSGGKGQGGSIGYKPPSRAATASPAPSVASLGSACGTPTRSPLSRAAATPAAAAPASRLPAPGAGRPSTTPSPPQAKPAAAASPGMAWLSQQQAGKGARPGGGSEAGLRSAPVTPGHSRPGSSASVRSAAASAAAHGGLSRIGGAAAAGGAAGGSRLPGFSTTNAITAAGKQPGTGGKRGTPVSSARSTGTASSKAAFMRLGISPEDAIAAAAARAAAECATARGASRLPSAPGTAATAGASRIAAPPSVSGAGAGAGGGRPRAGGQARGAAARGGAGGGAAGLRRSRSCGSMADMLGAGQEPQHNYEVSQLRQMWQQRAAAQHELQQARQHGERPQQGQQQLPQQHSFGGPSGGGGGGSSTAWGRHGASALGRAPAGSPLMPEPEECASPEAHVHARRRSSCGAGGGSGSPPAAAGGPAVARMGEVIKRMDGLLAERSGCSATPPSSLASKLAAGARAASAAAAAGGGDCDEGAAAAPSRLLF